MTVQNTLSITPSELISKVDAVKANAYDNETKMDWINKVEGMVQLEVMECREASMIVYTWERNKNTELIVKHPYTDLYKYYMYAMIDYENREISSYNNNMVMFNNAYESYQGYYNKTQKDNAICFTHYW